MADGPRDAFRALAVAAARLPETTESTSYGTPALKVRKKLLARVKDADTVVLVCSFEDKEMLLATAPDLYFETDHYRGWPLVLVRIHDIGIDELRHRLEKAWLMQAPKTLAKAWLADTDRPA